LRSISQWQIRKMLQTSVRCYNLPGGTHDKTDGATLFAQL